MRSFIRHPTGIPIQISLEDRSSQHEPLQNVSRGGLSFKCAETAPVGSNIIVRIALTSPPFEAHCQVSWCQADGNAWQVGVQFLDKDDLFRARMVEQICHIEQYRRNVHRNEGRTMSSHEAALEWIARFADTFPLPNIDSERPRDKQK